MNQRRLARRNPGPNWGFGFVSWAAHRWPRWFFEPMLKAGAWVALLRMPEQRKHSSDFLAVVFGRPARTREVWRHFHAFGEFLVLKLRAGRGAPVRCVLDPENAGAFHALARSHRPALFGTFHFGASDLLGYLLSEHGRRVSILRMRVGNSSDTRLLGERFAGQVSFIWTNDPSTMLFDLKAALDAGESLALKCDRLEFSSRNEPFEFLGATRLFPFTVYHLAVLFDRPVVFCSAIPEGQPGSIAVFSSPVFTPDATASRAANLQVARAHFQTVLSGLETLIRQQPYLWFNFLPLNPVTPPPAG